MLNLLKIDPMVLKEKFLMHIKIQHRFEPFSHEFGTECLLPYTSLSFQFFPTKIIIRDIFYKEPRIVGILTNNLIGPIEKFLVSCDLEKKILKMEGQSLHGFFRFHFQPLQNNNGFKIVSKKHPLNIQWNYEGSFQRIDEINIMNFYGKIKEVIEIPTLEKLFLGISKKQDWDLVKRRGSMEEILPFWFYFGQMFLNYPMKEEDSLFQQTLISIKNRDKLNILSNFTHSFKVGFKGMLVPTLLDEKYQGFTLPAIISETALALLTEGYKAIKMMFFQEDNETLQILPTLPPEFHHGRMINLQSIYGTIDIEWTKKTIRQMIFKCKKSANLSIIFQKRIRKYRLNKKIIDSHHSLSFEEGSTYYFDNFTK